MDSNIRFDDGASKRPAHASNVGPRGLARELAEQVEILADEPSQAVTYSDLYDHLLSGVRSFRRVLLTRHAHAVR